MKKNLLIGLLAVMFAGEGYIGFEVTRDSLKNFPDLAEIPSDSLIIPSLDTGNIYICSFNIKFLGSYTRKDNVSLAHLLRNFDIVIIQELVAPPYSGVFPDGEKFKPSEKSALFFNEMEDYGFRYILSDEDTGTGETIHSNGTGTEWWAAFYKSEKAEPADDLPHGFLDEDRSKNPSYDRVPYAFAFRSPDQASDFVLISVHLAADKEGKVRKARRREELAEINSWIKANDETEKDFIILGDMNINNKEEYSYTVPNAYKSLNINCLRTNITVNDEKDMGARPYDHVLYNPGYTANEIDETFNLVILDLVSMMKPYWKSTTAYPGDPLDEAVFCQYYSDHLPVFFRINRGEDDD